MIDEKQFKRTFDQVRASDALFMEVLNMTEQKTVQRRPKPVGRTVLIAAILICALTLTAVAADALTKRMQDDTIPVIDAFFGDSGDYAQGESRVEYDEYGKLAINMPGWRREPVDMEVAERLVAPYLFTLKDNTVTVDGFTYTIHAVLYDSNTKAYMVRWSVENPDGLGDYGIGLNGEFFTKEGSDIFAVCGGRAYIDTEYSTDTKLYISDFGVDWQTELTCEFGRWYDWNKGKLKAWNDTQTIIIPREDYGGMQALRFDGDSLILSPVALHVKAHVDAICECVITFRDGSQYIVLSDEQFIQNTTYGLGDESEVTYTFNRIVDVEQVSAVTINGETFTVQ